MKYLFGFLVLVLGSMPLAHAQDEAGTTCPDGTAILYKPSLAKLQVLLVQLKKVSDPAGSHAMTEEEYRGHAKLYFRVGPEGVPTPSINQSTGNRKVDRALVDWAKEIRFTQSTCLERTAVVPLEL